MSFVHSKKESSVLMGVSEVDIRTWVSLAYKTKNM